MSPEGELILFYASNLYLQGHLLEALKVIEDFGLVVDRDRWLRANLLKLNGIVLENCE